MHYCRIRCVLVPNMSAFMYEQKKHIGLVFNNIYMNFVVFQLYVLERRYSRYSKRKLIQKIRHWNILMIFMDRFMVKNGNH